MTRAEGYSLICLRPRWLRERIRLLTSVGGTGALAEAILDRLPQCTVLVRDIDREMLALAQARLSRFGNRFAVEAGSFDDALPRVDGVLAAFALHHIRNLNEKTEVYRRIREAIRPEGVFLNADAVSGPLWRALRQEWAEFMAGQGFTLEQAYQNLDNLAVEDRYFSVHEELCALAQAGFEHPECSGGAARLPFSVHESDRNLAMHSTTPPRRVPRQSRQPACWQPD